MFYPLSWKTCMRRARHIILSLQRDRESDHYEHDANHLHEVTMSFDLEGDHHKFAGKLRRGRPEVLLLRMSNGRNVQLFRRGTIQILSPP